MALFANVHLSRRPFLTQRYRLTGGRKKGARVAGKKNPIDSHIGGGYAVPYFDTSLRIDFLSDHLLLVLLLFQSTSCS